MGIEGIDNLKGYNMENEQPQQPQEHTSPGSQQDETASPPPEQAETPAPPVPAHEETERVTPQPDQDVAPDNDDPGDTTLPEELKEHVHEGDVPQDEVDRAN
jgi:hypothetical protein